MPLGSNPVDLSSFQRLERRVRRLQLTLFALLMVWVLTAAAGLQADSKPASLVAQRFEVVNEHGQVRAVLRAHPGGAELVRAPIRPLIGRNESAFTGVERPPADTVQ